MTFPFCRKHILFYQKLVSAVVALCFSFFTVAGPAGSQVALMQAIGLTNVFQPPLLRGMTVHPENPLLFDFIVDRGDDKIGNELLKDESTKLIKYFLTSMTIPDKDAWVNLSPYEKDRIIPDALGQTEMGRQMLEQDSVLKQLAASLTNPDKELGQKFWNEVKTRAQKQFGTTEIPLNTFDKVWIIPAGATVVEKDGFAYITESKLNVMLDEDYGSQNLSSRHALSGDPLLKIDSRFRGDDIEKLSTKVFCEMILPKLIEEVNSGKDFAATRQVYQSVILAAWYKRALKDSLLGRIYADKSKIAGVETDVKDIKQKVYEQYLEAFKKGAYNVIKEEASPDGELIPRKYFSGGYVMNFASSSLTVRDDPGHKLARAAIEELPQEQIALVVASTVEMGSGEKEIMALNVQAQPQGYWESIPQKTAGVLLGGQENIQAVLAANVRKFNQDGNFYDLKAILSVSSELRGFFVGIQEAVADVLGDSQSFNEKRQLTAGQQTYLATKTAAYVNETFIHTTLVSNVVLDWQKRESLEEELAQEVSKLSSPRIRIKKVHLMPDFSIAIELEETQGVLKTVKQKIGDLASQGGAAPKFFPDTLASTVAYLYGENIGVAQLEALQMRLDQINQNLAQQPIEVIVDEVHLETGTLKGFVRTDQGKSLPFSASSGILVVEDSRTVLAGIVQGLKKAGYADRDIHQAISAEAAVTLLENMDFVQRAGIKVIISDLHMGQRSGLQFLKEDAPKFLPDVPRILYTGDPTDVPKKDWKGILILSKYEDEGGGIISLVREVKKLSKDVVSSGATEKSIASVPVGGIDFDPSKLNLQIKRDGRGVPLPLPQQDLENIDIKGLYPVIINILPVNFQTLPILGQLQTWPDVVLSKG